MKSSSVSATSVLALALVTASTTLPLVSSASIPVDYSLFKRSVTTDASQLAGAIYDYIIVGGGLAGLVVANRLSANPNISVAVIEAGASGYADNNKFVVPAANLYDSSVGTQYDWQWTTTPQAGLSGRSAPWPRGKVLGGSSAINGLYYVRHSDIEQNAWADLINDQQDWTWDRMLDAMKKSETYTPPNQATTSRVSVPFDTSSHGTDGPVHVSYPQSTYPQVGAFLNSSSNVGIPLSQNPDAGQSWGAFLATSNINPTNSTRSFSRTAYLDPVTFRSNLDVLTGHLVTRITFNSTTDASGAVASGVEFSSSSGATPQPVYARKEVILCGGAVNDPQILQLSGIADAALLRSLGIQQVVDLPGVGYHLQDHLSTGVVFSPSSSATMPPTTVTGNRATDSYVNSAIAYVSGSTIFGDTTWSSLISQMRTDRDANVAAYDAPAAVKAGYNATYTAQVDRFFPSQIGPIELLFALSFGGVQVQAALQHPLSRGSIKVTSTNAFTPPAIDPAYLSNPVDMTILREGFKLARRVGSTAPLSTFTSSEVAPGSGVSSDAQWEEWIRGAVGTEFHPSSTCSMLPREQGGVVDSKLRVYGTQNVRVVDASVPPISFSAHLMSITYGLAEVGSEMILEDWTRGMVEQTNTTAASAGGGRGGSGGSGGGSTGSGAGRGATGGLGGVSGTNAAAAMSASTMVGIVTALVAVTASLLA
ncbi:Glucose-methanol-choline oxidoreductase, N-terminal [Kalmanozyma brasiliensis GHG001]|uniref:Choline dehydrogenase n=1 Tax=Kalmanozyma brasiliensis (strain GHG001) TaxID=1365824 RepID=V5EUY2_KALBG|nr:Glucose-methanol-choline oxidoreductase, N-terminal [Kalmanozyma brasiliensis GHG001]EST09215.1 Glucose-methanol-choline oxidoreductase, N-terminal [Kalmanozyma brasiliensis GHG001]